MGTLFPVIIHEKASLLDGLSSIQQVCESFIGYDISCSFLLPASRSLAKKGGMSPEEVSNELLFFY